MKARFLLQGADPGGPQVGGALAEAFSNPQFDEFRGLAAFVSLAGARVLLNLILSAGPRLRTKSLTIGVDQGGTSSEALEELAASGIPVYVFYSPSSPIFHPKVYLFVGQGTARAIVGSSNITLPGLFQNVEAAILVDLDLNDPDDRLFLEGVNAAILGFGAVGAKPLVNLRKLDSGLIKLLSDAELVPTEATRRSPDSKVSESDEDEEMPAVPTEIRAIFPPTKLPSVPSGLRPPRRQPSRPALEGEPQKPAPTAVPAAAPSAPSAPAAPTAVVHGPLLWKKSALPASDVQFDKPGTAVTGGVRLTQAGWQVAGRPIDQTTYFRNSVFGSEAWTTARRTPFVEMARVKFHVTILGSDEGEHILEVRHKPSGEAGQHNYTTLISWGSASPAIKRHDLRGRTLRLFGPPAGHAEPFYIEIV